MTSLCTCPTCGQPMPEPRLAVEAMRLMVRGRTSAPLLAALIDAYPKPLAAEQLIARIWSGDVDGGPLYAQNSLVLAVRNVRVKLKGTGWTIRSPRKDGQFGYRLAPLEA